MKKNVKVLLVNGKDTPNVITLSNECYEVMFNIVKALYNNGVHYWHSGNDINLHFDSISRCLNVLELHFSNIGYDVSMCETWTDVENTFSNIIKIRKTK